MLRVLLFVLLLVLLLGRAVPARADSWMPPAPADFLSDNGEWRFHVDPAAGKPNVAGSTPCTGTLARRGADGTFVAVWSAPLVNPIQPADCRVAEDGSFVATFDEWGSLGMTPRAVVVYDAAGKKRFSYALEDLFTKAELEKLTMTVSSRLWARDTHAIDVAGKRLVLRAEPRDVTIDLATGEVAPPAPGAR